MSTENGVTRSLIMLKSFPCNAQSVRASSSSITLTRMSDNRETSTRNDNDPSPTSDTEGRRTSRRGSVRRNEYEDDFRNILPLNIEYQTSSTTSGSLSEPREHIRIRFQPFEDAVPNPMPLPPTLSSSSNVDFSFSPYRIEAADANVQVGGGISASMDELDPVDSHLRMSSHPARDIHSAYAHQFPTLSVDPYARAPHTNIPPPPPDTFFPSDSWWSYEYIHHEGYPGPHMTSIRPGFAVEPQMPGPTPASSGNNEETVDERTEKKPAATPGRRKKKGQGTGSSEKQAPRKKTTPRKIRSRAQRSSNGSSSSSSPSAGSPGAKKGDAEANELVGPDPDEIQQATTDRARQALKSWHQRLNDLVRFREIHGHTNVPQKYSENPELGVWVNKQRMEKKAFDDEKKSSMTDKKISKLEQAGFKWAKPKGVGSWERRYRELQQYVHDHGDANVPTKFKANRALGRWVSTQRNMYKRFHDQGSFNNLSKAEIERRIRLLNLLGFSWNMAPTSGSDSAGGNDSGPHDSDNDDAPFELV